MVVQLSSDGSTFIEAKSSKMPCISGYLSQLQILLENKSVWNELVSKSSCWLDSSIQLCIIWTHNLL